MMAPVATRSVHARGYNNYNDYVSVTFHEVNLMLMNARNTQNIVYVYQRYGEDIMTPEQIAYGFEYIAKDKLEKTPDFWNIIVPMVKR